MGPYFPVCPLYRNDLSDEGGEKLKKSAYADGDTFRAVYTVRFQAAVYVLHVFQKKSKRGMATPKREMERIRQRLQLAQAHYQAWRNQPPDQR